MTEEFPAKPKRARAIAAKAGLNAVAVLAVTAIFVASASLRSGLDDGRPVTVAVAP